MGIFSYDNKFFQTLSLILDFVFLSLIWMISSLPIITMGAATTTLYHTVDKVFRREEGSLWKEYWRVFARDFKRATILWILVVAICAVLAANWFVAIDLEALHSGVRSFMQILSVFLAAFMAIWIQFWFPYLARFDDPVGRILKNTMALMVLETKAAMRLLGLFLLVVVLELVLSHYVPVLVLLLPVAYMISLNRILAKLFDQYIAQQEAAEQTV